MALNSDLVEQWLDSNPSFVESYFSRKAPQSVVDFWLRNHVLTPLASTNETASGESSPPLRRISAQEFGTSELGPILATQEDGRPCFLHPGTTSNNEAPRRRPSVRTLKMLDERELLYQLIMDISNDLEVTSLCHKILQNVSLLLDADRCSLFLIEGDYLVSSLFDVTSRSSLDESKDRGRIKVPLGTGIIGSVASTGIPLNIPDAYKDSRFHQEVDIRTGYKTRSVLSMPIKDMDGTVLGVAQAVNKSAGEVFTDRDEKIFSLYLAFCGIGIRNAQIYERSLLENKRNQLLLDLARLIFEEQDNLARLMYKILYNSQNLLQCQRCQVLLLGSSSGIFTEAFGFENSDESSPKKESGSSEPHFPINIGITGTVASTGKAVNIADAYQDERFDPSVEKDSKFRTKSVLVMPIKNAAGKVIGITQFINKLDGTPFNTNDEHLFEAIAIFVGMGINNTQMYEKAVQAMARQRVTMEVLSYHATASSSETKRFSRDQIASMQYYRLYDCAFDDSILDDDNTIRASLRMFIELGLLRKFHIPFEVMTCWLLSVKKNYRDVTYHNWRHAFNVAQMMFWMIQEASMRDWLSDLECLGLLTACLCHDLDHRGTNNQFQIKSMSPLATLYSTSVMEHHHFDQSLMILQTKGNEIFANLSAEDYERVVHYMESSIIATDLALYFRQREEFFRLVSLPGIDWSTEERKQLLKSMMMTASDIAAITKPWEIQFRVAELIATEFFEQGDKEKIELNIPPQDIMDRDKRDQLPFMQVGFIDGVCLPVYEALSKLSVNISHLVDGVLKNRSNWLKMSKNQS